jgi:hypothetical protein
MKFSINEEPVFSEGVDYRVDLARGVRWESYRGRVMLDDVKELAGVIGSDPACSEQDHCLIDLSGADLRMSANDVLRWALCFRKDGYRTRGWLVFVVGDSMAFGMVRMLGQWARCSHRIKIFRSCVDAELWMAGNLHRRPVAFLRGDEQTPSRPHVLAAV